MATWHQAADPLLHSDISALAATVSRHVHTCAAGEDLVGAMASAVAAACAPAAVGASRVATLIVPHDLSWERDGSAPSTLAPAATVNGERELAPGVQRFVREAAAALRACPRGKAALYLGGRAGLAESGCARGRVCVCSCLCSTCAAQPARASSWPAHTLHRPAYLPAPAGGVLLSCGRVAAATGAALLCESAFARLDRGAGLPNVQRLPYFPQARAPAALWAGRPEVPASAHPPQPHARMPQPPAFQNPAGGGRCTGPVRAAAAGGCTAPCGQLWVPGVALPAGGADGGWGVGGWGGKLWGSSQPSGTGAERVCRWATAAAPPHTCVQDEAVWEFDGGDVDLPAALRLLAEEVGGAAIRPGVNCGGIFCTPARPQLPAGECRRWEG